MPTVSKLMLEDVSTTDIRTTPGNGHPIIAQDVTDALYIKRRSSPDLEEIVSFNAVVICVLC